MFEINMTLKFVTDFMMNIYVYAYDCIYIYKQYKC